MIKRRSTFFAGALLLLALLLAAGGCGSGSSSDSGDAVKTTPAGKEVTEETLGVEIYPGSSPEEAFAGVYKMVTPDGYDKVVEFYKKSEPDAVFSETAIETGKGAAFVVDKSGFHGNISVEENLPSQGEVTITVSRFN